MKASQVAALFALLAVLASLALPGIPHSYATTEELLVNGGFEEGAEPWRAYSGTLDQTHDPDFVHDGSYAVTFTTSKQAGWFYQLVPVQPAGIYTFGGWAITEDANIECVFLRITWLDETGNTVAWHDSPCLSNSPTTIPTPTPEFAIVSRVIDGDTIELLSGEKVRYIGIDTPEIGQCYSQEATDKNRELVEWKEVRLEKDISETDIYHRLLRYVYVDELFVNAELVRLGYARAYSYPPDVKYATFFLELEQEAKDAGRGLWGVCATPTPTPTPMLTPTPDSSQYRFMTVAAQAPTEARVARVQGVVRLRSPGTPATAYFDDLSFTGLPPPTPSPSPSPTPSPSPSPTPTPSPSPSPTPTPTSTPSPTPAGTTANKGDVVINEVQYDPPQSGADNAYEWVELFNRTEEAIHLEGWRIRDNREEDYIPPLTLPANGFAVIAATEEGFYANFPDFDGSIVFLHGPIGNGLSNDGDCIILEDSEGRVIDALSYGDDTSQSPHCPDVAWGHSLERSPAGSQEFVDKPHPTPGYGFSPASTPAETPVETQTPAISPTETPTAASPSGPAPEPSGGSALSGMALRGVGIALAIALFGIIFWVARRRGSRK
jgi:micrococcal nuclease